MRQAGQNRIQSFAFVISACVAVCFCLGLVWDSAGEPAPKEREMALESRINPNDAPIESLVRLPGLGVARAGAIVACRENADGKSGESPAFQNWSDLQKVSGIGPKIAQDMSEWLKFE
jgi:DNA uptake protein ComE-like DNA-binding protein